MRARVASENGQVTVLAVGLLLVVLAVVGVATDATRAWLLRRELQTRADAAALAGASAIDIAAFRRSQRALIDVPRARLLIEDLVDIPDAAALVDVSPAAVRIVLRSAADAMFLSLVGVKEINVVTEAVARPAPGSFP